MPLNFFRKGATPDPDDDLDIGTNKENSVKHADNGEPMEETYIKRSPENLRYRSEDIRTKFDDLELVERSDRALEVMSPPDTRLRFEEAVGTQFTFNLTNTGLTGASNRDLVISPILSPGKLAADAAVFARYFYDDAGGGTFDIVTALKVYEGAHNIYIRVFKGSTHAGTALITVEGTNSGPPCDPLEGPIIINIDVSDDDSTTITHVVTALNVVEGGGGILNGITTSTVLGGGGNFVTVERDAVRIYEGDAGSDGGVDGELHKVPAAAIDAFFAAQYLLEGDSLAIDWLDAKTRQAANGTMVLTDANLTVISATDRVGVETVNTADAQGVIPICKILDSKLYFLNGKVFEKDIPDYLVPSKASATYDDHMAAATPGDQHDISVILNHHTVHVPGDYATLQLAITALAAGTGGTILLDTDSTAIIIPAISSHITVIGTSQDIKIEAAASTAITFNAATAYNITFRNLHITEVGNGILILNAQASHALPTSGSGAHFDNCKFSRAVSGAADVIQTSQSMKFTNCTINPANDAGGAGTLFELDNTTGGAANKEWVDIVVQDCYIENANQIIGVAAGATYIRSIIFENNLVIDCGDDAAAITGAGTAYDSYMALLDTTGADVIHLTVTGNTVKTTHASNEVWAARFGSFTSSQGTVANNFIDICPYTLFSSLPAVKPTDGGGSSGCVIGVSGPVVVRDNIIKMGGWSNCAVLTGAQSVVSGNEIYNWGWHNAAAEPTDTVYSLIVGQDHTRISDNYLRGDSSGFLITSTKYNYIYTPITAEYIAITGNTIKVYGDEATAIYIASKFTTVTGNTIDADSVTGTTGISMDTATGIHATISGNAMYDTFVGISVSATSYRASISGNTIEGNDVASSIGISVVARSTVTGNNIRLVKTSISVTGDKNAINSNYVDSGLYGIYVTGDNCAINGNSLTTFDTAGIFATGDNNTVNGNSIAGASPTAKGIHITDDANTVSGNSLAGGTFTTGIDIDGDKNSVASNILSATLTTGIDVNGSYNITAGNSVSTASTNGIVTSNYCNIVSGNSISGGSPTTRGIYARGLINSVTGNNLIGGTFTTGIDTDNSNNVISNNNIQSTTTTGIDLDGNDNAVSGNIIDGTVTTGINIGTLRVRNAVTGNSLGGSTTGILIGLNADRNAISGNALHGTTSKITDNSTKADNGVDYVGGTGSLKYNNPGV